MRFEAVTVCVGYADFLKEVASYNIPCFDEWIIVTTSADETTRALCHKLSLRCLLVDNASEGGEFKKGLMIERGLRLLSSDSWRIHVDCDICLPTRFRSLIAAASLDPTCIYGIDRIMVKNYAEWQRIKESKFLEQHAHAYHCNVNFPKGFSIGTRWVDLLTGYVPIGFFQMWHTGQDLWHGIRSKPYPQRHNDACRTDVQHGLQWDRNKRVLLPEVVCVHLESEDAALGINWKGRRSRPFGPTESNSPNSNNVLGMNRFNQVSG